MGTTYEDAGVNISKGDEVTERLKERLGIHTGFCATSLLPTSLLPTSLLPINPRIKVITSTDGVGTKLQLVTQFAPGLASNILGQDVVAAVFNDIITSGAAPWLFQDYIGAGQLNPIFISDLVEAINHHCHTCGATLTGGETAELGATYSTPNTMELVGFGVGLADDGSFTDGSMICKGDILIGLASSGPHCNGYTLINHLVYGNKLDIYRDEGLLYELTTPTVLYHPILKSLVGSLIKEYDFTHGTINHTLVGMAHITGGGLEANVNRMFSENSGLRANLNWDVIREITPEVFRKIQVAGDIATEEMYRVFNMGIGFVICVARENIEAVLEVLEVAGAGPIVIGKVEK